MYSTQPNFDVLKFINRIETLYDAQKERQPATSTLEFRKRQPASENKDGQKQNKRPFVKREAQTSGRPARRDQKDGANKSFVKKRPNQPAAQGSLSSEAAGDTGPATPSTNFKTVRLQGIAGEVDSAMEIANTRENVRKVFRGGAARPSRPRARFGGNQKALNNGFKSSNSSSSAFKRRPFVKGNAKDSNARNNQKSGSSDRPQPVSYSLSPQEGLSIIARLVHDPVVKTGFATVESLDPTSLTRELDPNALTTEAALWSALKKLSPEASKDEITQALETSFKGLSLDSLSAGAKGNVNTVAFVNAANRNFGIPLESKQALLDVVSGKGAVQSVIRS